MLSKIAQIIKSYIVKPNIFKDITMEEQSHNLNQMIDQLVAENRKTKLLQFQVKGSRLSPSYDLSLDNNNEHLKKIKKKYSFKLGDINAAWCPEGKYEKLFYESNINVKSEKLIIHKDEEIIAVADFKYYQNRIDMVHIDDFILECDADSTSSYRFAI